MITFFTVWFVLWIVGYILSEFTSASARESDAGWAGPAFLHGVIVAAAVSLLVYAYFFRILPKAWGE